MSNTFFAFAVCGSYVFVGLGLILLNQYILKDLHFPYPMFLSGLGVFASAIFARVLVRLGVSRITKTEAVEGILWYQRVLPVGLASAGTFAFGNMAYLYLDVGFIQMLKSFTPVVIILFAYLSGVETPTMPVVYSVIIISIGIAATCSFSPTINVLGLTIMMLSAVMEAVRLVLTQFLLKQCKFGVVEGQYVLSPASALWLFIASALFEFRQMYENNAMKIIVDNFSFFLLASVAGVVVNFMAYSVIQATNSLTMKMLGTLRSIITIGFGVMLFKEVITEREAEGYLFALAGFVMYNMASSGMLDRVAILQLTPDKAIKQLCTSGCAPSTSPVAGLDVEVGLPLLAVSLGKEEVE